MTLLIVLLSVANIALGYGLAIYLGHALAPWANYKRATNSRPSASREESRESRDDYTDDSDGVESAEVGSKPLEPTVASKSEPSPEPIDPDAGTIGQANDENDDEAAAEAVAETADELAEEVAKVEENLVAKDETSLEERSAAEMAGTDEGDAVEEDAVVGDSSDETPEVSAKQEVLDNLETIREEIHEQPEPPTVEEALAAETESSISEPAIPESEDQQETAASAAVPEGELMQGIGAFQEQLKARQESSKLHAVNDTSNHEHPTEASGESDASDASAEPAVG